MRSKQVATLKAVNRIAELYERYGRVEDAKKAWKHAESLKKRIDNK